MKTKIKRQKKNVLLYDKWREEVYLSSLDISSGRCELGRTAFCSVVREEPSLPRTTITRINIFGKYTGARE